MLQGVTFVTHATEGSKESLHYKYLYSDDKALCDFHIQHTIQELNFTKVTNIANKMCRHSVNPGI